MTNLLNDLTSAFNELSNDDKVRLWNNYCQKANMMDDQAISVDQVEDLYPLSSFDSIKDVIQMYSSVTNNAGDYICDYVILNGYDYLVPFNANDDIDVEKVVNAVADGSLYRVLPDELMEVMDNAEEEEAE